MGAWGPGAIWGGARRRGWTRGPPPQNSPPRLRRELPPAECLRETPHHQNRPGKGVDGERGCGGGTQMRVPAAAPRSPCPLSPPVSVCKFIPKSFLHRFLPQRHGAAQGGKGQRTGPARTPPKKNLPNALGWTDGRPRASGTRTRPPPLLLSPHAASPLTGLSLSVCLSVLLSLPQLLLIFSLSQSLMRQLKEALLPFIFLHLHLSLIFFKGLLGFCWRLGVSKVGAGRAGGRACHPRPPPRTPAPGGPVPTTVARTRPVSSVIPG